MGAIDVIRAELSSSGSRQQEGIGGSRFSKRKPNFEQKGALRELALSHGI